MKLLMLTQKIASMVVYVRVLVCQTANSVKLILLQHCFLDVRNQHIELFMLSLSVYCLIKNLNYFNFKPKLGKMLKIMNFLKCSVTVKNYSIN